MIYLNEGAPKGFPHFVSSQTIIPLTTPDTMPEAVAIVKSSSFWLFLCFLLLINVSSFLMFIYYHIIRGVSTLFFNKFIIFSIFLLSSKPLKYYRIENINKKNSPVKGRNKEIEIKFSVDFLY